MDLRCLFGCHDYEPFGDGVKLLDIIERSAKIKADALYMKEYTKEIFYYLRSKEICKYYGDIDARIFMFEKEIIKDEVCLRCGKIKPNIQIFRAATDSQAIFAGSVIRIREDRQKKAKAMLDYKKELDCI